MLYAILGMLTLTATAAPAAAPDVRALAAARHRDAPGIRLWISGRDLFHHGDRARLYYRTERDAFVTILRVDTDGRVRVLFPTSPHEDSYAYGGSTYAVSSYARGEAFVVDDDPGVGYVFAVASEEPFDYRAILDGNDWDLRLASGGRIHGDPLASLEELVQQMLPADYTDFDTHLVPYYVERRYDYPRFVCYDCHAYTPWVMWDPYMAWCRSFTLVIWNDPFYYYPSYWYPTWYYGGTRVVYVTPGSSGANRGRYVFKTREASQPGIDYRDRRRTSDADRRAGERFVRGTDFGGVGSVPAPSGGRRTVDPSNRHSIEGGFSPADRGERREPQATEPRRRTSERQDWQALAPTPSERRRAEASRSTVTEGPDRVAPEAGRSSRPERRAESDRRGEPERGAQVAPSPGARSEPRVQPRSGGNEGRSRPAASPAPRSGGSGSAQPRSSGSSGSRSQGRSPDLVRRRPS